jgi:DNA mismatch repair protein MutS
MSNNNKKSIYEEYFEIHEDSVKRYGDLTAVFMMVGDFYELYSYLDRGPNLLIITDLMDIVLTKKSNEKELAPNNPNMSGFHIFSLNKYVSKLLKHNYTIVVIDQNKNGTEISREITQVISPSTNIDDLSIENKYLMVLYIEINNMISSKKCAYSCGLTALDCLSNSLIIYELNSNDIYYFLNEITRFYMSYIPEELIIYEINNSNNSNERISHNINFVKDQYYKIYNQVNYNYTKIKYQNKFFEKVYGKNKIISSIEELKLQNYNYLRISLIIALEFINQRNPNILLKIKKPKYYSDDNFMRLYNNSQHQLNIIDTETKNYTSAYSSLNDVINQCITPMGKKYLKERICAPYINLDVINGYYNFTDLMIKNNNYENIRELLKGIYDLQKLFRKLTIKYLKPVEFIRVYLSLKNSHGLINNLLKTDIKNYIYEIFNEENINELQNIINYIDETFNMDILRQCDLTKLQTSIYKQNKHPDIDNLQNNLMLGNNCIDVIEDAFKKYDDKVIIKYTKKSKKDKGYYVKLPLKNGLKLKERIINERFVEVNGCKIMFEDMEFKVLKNEVRIKFLSLNDQSSDIDMIKEKLSKLCLMYYKNETKDLYNNNEMLFDKLIKLLIKIDYVSNNAYISNKFHYSKPIIKNSNNSFINSKQIRHPIIERLIENAYVPNDILLDDNNSGIMLYSLNSAGKSSLMKTVGLCLIMAQCGLYVPSTYFEYSIFNSLFTRITSQDNLFKGQSSFVVELVEMDIIFSYANKNSLVIGDEVCRGTEVLSANSLVASSISYLLSKNVKFLFATHLHDIVKLKKIKEYNNLKFFHLSVDIDDNLNINFNRNLTEGIGMKNYGLLVASHVLHNKDIINEAHEFKKELLTNQGINYKIMNDKKSLYNNNFYVDKCTLCGSQDKLEVHHILQQKDFKNGVYKELNKFHIVKDEEHNLMVLCMKCHDEVHLIKKH